MILVSLVVYSMTPEVETEEVSACVIDETAEENSETTKVLPDNRYLPNLELWKSDWRPVMPVEHSGLEISVENDGIPQQNHKEQTDVCEYSEYEIDLIARTIFQESGICSEYCQWLVGSTILNLADERGGIESVVFDYNTFNVAYKLFDDTPSELSYKVARRVVSGDRDYKVKAFRTDYYHGFGTPYIEVDNVYFSEY